MTEVEEVAMKALVVFESMFGNTEQVARAVADGIGESMDVDVREVSSAPAPIEEPFDLVVVGAPTHAFSLSRASTRADAVRQGAAPARQGVGVREWIGHLHRGPHSEVLATFDTRVGKVRHLPGSAARRAAKLLRTDGYRPERTESFYVGDVSGPLLPGELERARRWGLDLAEHVVAPAHGRKVP